jgi:hypothetical protein
VTAGNRYNVRTRTGYYATPDEQPAKQRLSGAPGAN